MITIRLRHYLTVTALAALAVTGCSADAGGTGGHRPAGPRPARWPVTSLHYAPNGNFGQSGRYLPAADGFNLADVEAAAGKSALDRLPADVRGLVWLGKCDGATAGFRAAADAYAGDPRLFGFYVMDEPVPSSCPPAHLLAEDNWIHAHVRGALTFAILGNLGSAINPTFAGSYTPKDSGLDLIGLDPYPVRSELHSPGYAEIARYVRMATAAGWSLASIVPVYQAFGGGGYSDDGDGHWVLPDAAEEHRILAGWAAVVPAPVFDYAYSWGSQDGDTALGQSPALQAVFAAKNARPKSS
ncbi:MAG: hypothetical protein JO037_16840 [Actinobacteria bacterium]|nr:hypothetical protein [Actinomycetota bacterium]